MASAIIKVQTDAAIHEKENCKLTAFSYINLLVLNHIRIHMCSRSWLLSKCLG